MGQVVKFRPTPKKELRDLLHDIQKGIDIYDKLPKRKQRKKKNLDAHTDLVLLEKMIMKGYHHEMRIGDIEKWKSTISNRNKLLNKSLKGGK